MCLRQIILHDLPEHAGIKLHHVHRPCCHSLSDMDPFQPQRRFCKPFLLMHLYRLLPAVSNSAGYNKIHILSRLSLGEDLPVQLHLHIAHCLLFDEIVHSMAISSQTDAVHAKEGVVSQHRDKDLSTEFLHHVFGQLLEQLHLLFSHNVAALPIRTKCPYAVAKVPGNVVVPEEVSHPHLSLAICPVEILQPDHRGDNIANPQRKTNHARGAKENCADKLTQSDREDIHMAKAHRRHAHLQALHVLPEL
mmetsp:Transcript_2874/g.7264  ORF Transcript_2874/g.7264 Transcript_2874/m.7264 type:complete len:249 (-) Transcript_2874:1001-1747(-)